jgi:hypothetical protein
VTSPDLPVGPTVELTPRALVAPVLGTQGPARLGEPALWGGALLLSVLAGAGLWGVSAAAGRRAAAVPA